MSIFHTYYSLIRLEFELINMKGSVYMDRQNNFKELFSGGKFAIFLMQKNGDATDVALRVCKCCDGFLVNRSCFDFSNVADDLPEIRKAITEPDVKIILTGEADKQYLVNKFGIATENMYMLQDIAEAILQGEIPRDKLQTLADIHQIFYPNEDGSGDTLSQKTDNIRKDINNLWHYQKLKEAMKIKPERSYFMDSFVRKLENDNYIVAGIKIYERYGKKYFCAIKSNPTCDSIMIDTEAEDLHELYEFLCDCDVAIGYDLTDCVKFIVDSVSINRPILLDLMFIDMHDVANELLCEDYENTGGYLFLLNRFLLSYPQLHYNSDFDTLLDFCSLAKEISSAYKKITNT